MGVSCVTGARLPPWSDGRSRICPCTPFGRHWWLSCSRPCSATGDVLPRALHRFPNLRVLYISGGENISPENVLRDGLELQVRCAFVDLADLRVPIQLLDRIILDEPVAAVQIHGERRDALGHFRREDL